MLTSVSLGGPVYLCLKGSVSEDPLQDAGHGALRCSMHWEPMFPRDESADGKVRPVATALAGSPASQLPGHRGVPLVTGHVAVA